MSKIINPKEIPALMKQKAHLYKVVDVYLKDYERTKSDKSAKMIKKIVEQLKDINGKLGISHLPKIDGVSSLAKEAVTGGKKSFKSA